MIFLFLISLIVLILGKKLYNVNEWNDDEGGTKYFIGIVSILITLFILAFLGDVKSIILKEVAILAGISLVIGYLIFLCLDLEVMYKSLVAVVSYSYFSSILPCGLIHFNDHKSTINMIAITYFLVIIVCVFYLKILKNKEKTIIIAASSFVVSSLFYSLMLGDVLKVLNDNLPFIMVIIYSVYAIYLFFSDIRNRKINNIEFITFIVLNLIIPLILFVKYYNML